MKLLIDMNLSPKWVSTLREAGWDAVHWSDIGKPNAPDHEILGFARANGYVIFTHDLDFATILAATKAELPKCDPDSLSRRSAGLSRLARYFSS
jgi:predicted nuclease of predicted toxin-antitoxin system